RLTWPALLALLGLGVLLLPLAPALSQGLRADPPRRPPAVDKPADTPAETPRAANTSPPPATTSRPAPAKAAAAGEVDLAGQIEKAQDEVELLEAELQAVKAEQRVAAATLAAAKDNMARMQQLVERGVVTEKSVLEARLEVPRAEASLQVAEAKLTQ